MTPCIDHRQKGRPDGYGHSQGVLLHRRVFFRHYGFLPEAVMHTCDNPRCINIDHLQAGTRDLNNKDRAAKGRSAKHRPDKRKLTDEQVAEIRTRYSPKRCRVNGVSALSREFGVDTNVIYQIVQYRTYTDSKGTTTT